MQMQNLPGFASGGGGPKPISPAKQKNAWRKPGQQWPGRPSGFFL